MITLAILSVLLLSNTESGPKILGVMPYFGYDVAIYIEDVPGMTRTRSRYFHFGAGLPILSFGEKAFPFKRLVVSPEFAYGTSLYALTVTAGPEWEIPFGFRQKPNRIVGGIAGGFIYGYHNGKAPVTYNRKTLAIATHLYFGPGFDFSDRIELRLLASTRMYVGSVQKFTFRTAFSRQIGWTMGGIFQLNYSF